MIARLLVTGGRNVDPAHVGGVLSFMRGYVETIGLFDVHRERKLVIVHCAREGLAEQAEAWARSNGVETEAWPAASDEYEAHRARNAAVVASRPMWLIAFLGDLMSADCATRAVLAGLTVGGVDRQGELRWWDPVPVRRTA